MGPRVGHLRLWAPQLRAHAHGQAAAAACAAQGLSAELLEENRRAGRAPRDAAEVLSPNPSDAGVVWIPWCSTGNSAESIGGYSHPYDEHRQEVLRFPLEGRRFAEVLVRDGQERLVSTW